MNRDKQSCDEIYRTDFPHLNRLGTDRTFDDLILSYLDLHHGLKCSLNRDGKIRYICVFLFAVHDLKVRNLHLTL